MKFDSNNIELLQIGSFVDTLDCVLELSNEILFRGHSKLYGFTVKPQTSDHKLIGNTFQS